MNGPGRGSGTCRVLEVRNSWVYLRNRKDSVNGKTEAGGKVGCEQVEEVGRDQIT